MLGCRCPRDRSHNQQEKGELRRALTALLPHLLRSSSCAHPPPLRPTPAAIFSFSGASNSRPRRRPGCGRLRSDLWLSRNVTKLPNLNFLVLKIKQSSQSKHHRLTSQPKAEEKCLMFNFLAHNRIYEHFQCFDFLPPSLLFLTPQS